MRRSRLALLLVLLVCAAKAYSFYTEKPILTDFTVYETAASLVREHRSLLMYNGADTGQDPQLRLADPNSLFAQQAQKLGISEVRLYVSPPVLADLLLPFGFLSATTAGWVWTAVNAMTLAGVVWLLLRLFPVSWSPAGVMALVFATAVFTPTMGCIYWGQITIVLLALWTVGVFCYVRGWVTGSALALALATSIKLTPLLAIVPFVLWKEWRWLRMYAVGLVVIFAGVVALNGWACVEDCFRHVIPAMSAGVPNKANHSIISELQQMYSAAKHGKTAAVDARVFRLLTTVGKVIGLICIVGAAALIARWRALTSPYTRAVVLGMIAMLSVLVSPVSWAHAYAICLLPLVLLWGE
ncbi:MAG: DUF2029 domain-containing protein, partial [Rhodospirillales bacterium]|nr:DUF2029 domain-containing protein [Acetobacter sp.]